MISTTGKVAFKNITAIEQQDWNLSLNNKLLGQINLVQIGSKYINDGGSFTLTSGILNFEPIAMGSIAATVNAGLEGFVKAASLEYNKFRINVVSPTVVEEALDKYAPFFIGFKAVKAEEVANAYLKSVAGIANGEVIKVGFNLKIKYLNSYFLITLSNTSFIKSCEVSTIIASFAGLSGATLRLRS